MGLGLRDPLGLRDSGFIIPPEGRPLRALIFDFDGLMVDSETAVYEAWREVYRAHGAALTLEEWLRAVGYVAGFDPRRRLAEATGRADLDWTVIDAALARRIGELMAGQGLLPGVRDLLRAGAAAGWRLGVASNSTADWVRPNLERLGLQDVFGTVCTRGGDARPKPAPDLYLAAVRHLLGPDADPAGGSVAFEDSQPGVEAAAAAGLRVVAVPSALTRHQDLSAAHETVATLAGYRLPH